MANALAGLGKILSGLIPKKKAGDPNAPLLMEPGQAEWEALRELGIGDPGVAPADRSLVEPAAPIFPFEAMGGAGDVSGTIQEPPRRRSDELFTMLEGFMKDAQTPAPEATRPQVQPLEQLLELYAVSQGGASNLGGAYDLASQRTAFGDAQAMRAWESKTNAAKSGLQYGVPLFNAALDQETALDQLEYKMKAATLADQARRAASAIKSHKEARQKIGALVAAGQEDVVAFEQILLGSMENPDPDLARATAEEIFRDVKMNPRGWLIQHKEDTRQDSIAKGQTAQYQELVKRITARGPNTVPEDRVNAMHEAAEFFPDTYWGKTAMAMGPQGIEQFAAQKTASEVKVETDTKVAAERLGILQKENESFWESHNKAMANIDSIMTSRKVNDILRARSVKDQEGRTQIQMGNLSLAQRRAVSDAYRDAWKVTQQQIGSTNSQIRMLQNSLKDTYDPKIVKQIQNEISRLRLLVDGGSDEEGNFVTGLRQQSASYDKFVEALKSDPAGSALPSGEIRPFDPLTGAGGVTITKQKGSTAGAMAGASAGATAGSGKKVKGKRTGATMTLRGG